MAKFAGRRGDLTWGRFNYPVTKTQHATLEGLLYMMSGLPKGRGVTNRDNANGYFCSQRPDNGGVVMGLMHQSVTVHRNGRVTSNRGKSLV